MPKFISSKVTKNLIKQNIKISASKVLILGFTFKENCPDFRNTKVLDLHNELVSFDMDVDIYDYCVDKEEVYNQYKINILEEKELYKKKYECIILAVSHKNFINIDLDKLSNTNTIVFDLKGFLKREDVTFRL